MPPTESPLDRVRAELQSLGDEEVAKDEPGDALLDRALGHLQSDDLLSSSVDLMDSVPGAVELPPGEEERARQRVQRAAVLLREQAADAATLLWEAREAVGLSDQQACEALTLSPAALKRVEGGRGIGVLLNKEPEQVAAYIRRLAIDPRLFLAALFASARPSPPDAHRPPHTNHRTGSRLEAAYPGTKDSDRKWALAFLQDVGTRS